MTETLFATGLLLTRCQSREIDQEEQQKSQKMRYQRTNSIADAPDEKSRLTPTLTRNSMSITPNNHEKWENNYFVDVWHLNKEKAST